jgi:NAD(P)-dependent dehydrogenase (short-subunit alcohol dehydrogenase family)
MAGSGKTALVIGASRTIGLAVTSELLQRGWRVVATVRGRRSEEFHQLVKQAGRSLTVERLDITEPAQISALRERLGGVSLDLLFVIAGITDPDKPVGEVPTEIFTEVMVTNALSPMRVVEGLGPLVTPGGTIAVMSSRQGSVSLNTRGGHEVYRASKSALNQLMRSYAARQAGDPRTLLLMHPGWVQTGLGGPGAPLSIGEARMAAFGSSTTAIRSCRGDSDAPALLDAAFSLVLA